MKESRENQMIEIDVLSLHEDNLETEIFSIS